MTRWTWRTFFVWDRLSISHGGGFKVVRVAFLSCGWVWTCGVLVISCGER